MNDNGLQAILNLRLVCKTTQGWVDNLKEQEGIRVFDTRKARLDFNEEKVLQSFINSPISPFLSSFVLVNVEKFKTNPTCLELWPQVLNDWIPKVISLDVNALTVPFDPHLDPLLSSTSLVELRVGSLLLWENTENNSTQSQAKEIFYKSLAYNPRLKIVDLEIKDKADLAGVNCLLETRKHDPEFQCTLRFVKEPEE